MRVTLTGTSSAVPLGNDYYVVAPSLRGDIEVSRGLQGLGRGPTGTSVVLDAAIANAGLIEQVNLEFISVTRPANTRVGRGTEPPVTLVAPDLGARTGHVLLVVNQAGALSWIFPAPTSTARSRSGKQVTFAIPTAETADDRGRGIIGTVGIKVLKAFVYPITDEMLGGKIATLVNDWEEKHRAYHVRSFRPEDYRRPDPRELTRAEWDALRKGRSLLFLHGTFSTSHGAFGDLEPTTFAQLFAMYQGRVIAFDHHTMSHTPEQNVHVLLERIPAGSPIDVDIICHSRGGLVARELAERRPQAPLRVHKVVFVGATNAGTILADPEHMIHVLDRLTTLLNIFPTGQAGEVLDAILLIVKIVGHAGLVKLVGLASMSPSGSDIATLNQGGAPYNHYYALAADYDPVHPALRSITARAANATADYVFGDIPNDLVVPTTGVYSENGMARFPIPSDRRHEYTGTDGVMHTNFFTKPTTAARLIEWLSPHA